MEGHGFTPEKAYQKKPTPEQPLGIGTLEVNATGSDETTVDNEGKRKGERLLLVVYLIERFKGQQGREYAPIIRFLINYLGQLLTQE